MKTVTVSGDLVKFNEDKIILLGSATGYEYLP